MARAVGELELIESASAPNENAARGRTHAGLPVDLRVVAPENFGNLLQHFTGSAAHNVALREAAVRRGLHVSEYGILDDATGETTLCATEEEVYERLGLAYPEPELRENRGELAPGFVAPQLVTVEDLRGDLHMHTRASDGRDTIEEMARAGLARGYEYLAITDHSATHGFGNHVTPDELEHHTARARAHSMIPPPNSHRWRTSVKRSSPHSYGNGSKSCPVDRRYPGWSVRIPVPSVRCGLQ